MTTTVNPFKELSPSHRKEVRRQRIATLEVRKRFERIQLAYRELVNDPRYKDIQEELSASLGEQLQELLKTARACSNCSPTAVRVDALNDIVARPLHQMWMEAQRSRMESIPEDISDVV